ncbi:glycosyltransferase [Fulvivirga ulvae]|uniref:glycosyltransferase n=1 Tax=Fulvivirga ulvae TaxID=2904245 RepID=UPI001F1EFE10|nr:glycosyltransferase [Fulvivirga ulvae]UII31460.1 glycosyltransferase [Fulvivirga ulvae]
MKIAIFTLGTQGDVQPFAVLGQALKKRGHQVTLSTTKNFDALVKSYDIDFLPVEADFHEFLNSEEGRKMMKNPFRAKKKLSIWVYPMIYKAMKAFYKLSKESDRVIFHVKTMGDYFADQFPEKMIKANVVPAIEYTTEFVNPIFSALPIPSFLNRLTYKLSDLGVSLMMKPVKEFRRDEGLPLKFKKPTLPSIYGISNHYLKKPNDYPDHSHFTGFWTSPSSTELEEDLVDFINQGSAPLLITFGSMTFETKMDLPKAIEKLSDELKVRVIVVKGWGFNNTKTLDKNPNIKVIKSAPYDKLFTHVKAVINHGGIGTISACLMAGKPFFACPVLYPLGDQHFWATIGYQKGVALKPKNLKSMTEKDLIENSRALLSTESLYKNSIALSKKIKQENGLQKAIELIEGNIW